jgi:hypothetical protein
MLYYVSTQKLKGDIIIMFGVELDKFKANRDTVYKIPVIEIDFMKLKSEQPNLFANVDKPVSENNVVYVNIPILNDLTTSKRLANYIINTCGDSRLIF